MAGQNRMQDAETKSAKAQESDVQPISRAKYEPPRLKEFGQVGMLTQGGSGAMVEGSQGMGGGMGSTMNPNRRP